MNIQNHQMLPAGAHVLTAKAMKMKASPMKMPLNARSMLGGLSPRWRRRRPCRVPSSLAAASRSASAPLMACGTSPMSVPQDRQNLASSALGVAHFGQNICLNLLFAASKSLANGFVEHYAGRDRDVQRFYPTAQRDADKHVAALAHEAA